jgi:PAS domain S-box-containing protein
MDNTQRKRKKSSYRKQAKDQLTQNSLERQKIYPQDPAVLIHELQVHQVELKKQNEDLRQAQEELAKARDKFQELFDSAPVGYFILSTHNIILDVNQTGTLMLSHTKTDLYKQRFTSFIEERDQASYNDQIIVSLRDCKTQELDLDMVRGDHSQFSAHLHIVPVKDEAGKLTQLRITVADVSERKKIEETIKKSEEKYRILFENMTGGFVLGEVVLDDKGKPYDLRLLEINETWGKPSHISRDKAINRTYRELVSQPLEDFIQKLGRVALTGETTTFEMYSPDSGVWFNFDVYCPAKVI